MMKKIITLLLLTVMLACEKDKPEPIKNNYLEQKVFNALIGTWKPNRCGYDINFNKNIPIDNDPWLLYCITFKTDSTFIGIDNLSTTEIYGKFKVRIGNDNSSTDTTKFVDTSYGAIWTSPGYAKYEGICLLTSTDSTFIISTVVDKLTIFSEFKRVK